jgi:hypothetical protein
MRFSFWKIVKYSGRVAEGIRGNSGERSSKEFLENEVYPRADLVFLLVPVLPFCL